MAYRKVEDKGGADYVKWDVIGKSFEGRFVGMGTGSYEGRVTHHAKFVDASGQEKRVDVPAVLKRRLESTDPETRIAPGSQCRITFTGTKKGKQPIPMKLFDIEVDDSEAPAGDVEAAYQAAVAAKGEGVAKAIRAAVQNVAKGDTVKQAKMLREAAGVAA